LSSRKRGGAHQSNGNAMSGRLDRPWQIDPTLTGTFDLTLCYSYEVAGQANGLYVRKTFERMVVKNFRNEITDVSLGDAIQKFRGAGFDIADGSELAVNLNSYLRLVAGSQKLAAITPGMRVIGGHHALVFEVTPAAAAKAQVAKK
jgi:hypothetical protein